jgi:DNA invertase Pin-like site-specific DNA recombinase
MPTNLRAALYLRVSTDEQTTENQDIALTALAAQRGWTIVHTYNDAGVSGAKTRANRPGLDSLLNDAIRGQFDVVLAWSVDRLGRSLPDLLGTLQTLSDAKVGLVLHQQAIDTTTPAGRALFQMLGVFAEFERSMIQARIHAGLDRARKQGVRLGRPKVPGSKRRAVEAALEAGMSINKAAIAAGVGNSTAHRIALARAPS